MELKVFDKINKISVLADEIRFKIVLALFNSDSFKIGKKKLGTNSHHFGELKEIIRIPPNDLSYHLNVLIESKLIEKIADKRGCYHITNDAKSILKDFGVTQKLVQEVGNKLI